MSNLEYLRAAGITNPDYDFTAEEKALIESLTADELNAVISAKGKLGDDLIGHPNSADASWIKKIIF